MATIVLPTIRKGDVATWITTLVKPGMICVDVGAAEGEMTRAMIASGAASVLAIEPDDRHTPCEVGQWIRGAVTNQTGPVTIHRGAEPKQSSRFPGAVVANLDAPITVPGYRLDDLIEWAHLIKVDVQGGEVDVLDGAPKLLATHPMWLIELWPKGLLAAGATWRTLLSRFWDAGYDLFWEGGIEVTQERATQWARDAAERHHCNLLATVA